jgi:Domain of unknown function (DUF4440)
MATTLPSCSVRVGPCSSRESRTGRGKVRATTSKNEGGTVRIAGLLIVCLCSASLILSAQDDADGAIQSKIIALEKAWNQAYKHADRRALDRLLDDRIVLLNDDGSVQTKAEFLASVTKSKCSTTAGCTRIDERSGFRKYCDLDRSFSGEGNRTWEFVYAAR